MPKLPALNERSAGNSVVSIKSEGTKTYSRIKGMLGTFNETGGRSSEQGFSDASSVRRVPDAVSVKQIKEKSVDNKKTDGTRVESVRSFINAASESKSPQNLKSRQMNLVASFVPPKFDVQNESDKGSSRNLLGLDFDQSSYTSGGTQFERLQTTDFD